MRPSTQPGPGRPPGRRRQARAGRPCAPACGGVGLLEILFGLALVGILAALALPVYREQMARGQRAEALTVLLEDALYMHRYYASHNSYADTPGPVLPYPGSPRQAAVGAWHYDIVVSHSDGTSFRLTARRVPAGPLAGDRCGDLTYDDQTVKGIVNAAPGTDWRACWR